MNQTDLWVIGLSCVLFVILWLTVRAVYFEWEQIKYQVSCVWGHRHTAGLPTPPRIVRRALFHLDQVIRLHPDLTIVDFGCGDGIFLDHVHRTFPCTALIGVELEAASAQRSRERFQDVPSIRIETADMATFRFPNQPTLLYLYEPLWTIKAEVALPIYRTVLDHLQQHVEAHHPVLVLYVSGVHAHLTPYFFAPLRVVAHERIERFIGANHVYVLKR